MTMSGSGDGVTVDHRGLGEIGGTVVSAGAMLAPLAVATGVGSTLLGAALGPLGAGFSAAFVAAEASRAATVGAIAAVLDGTGATLRTTASAYEYADTGHATGLAASGSGTGPGDPR